MANVMLSKVRINLVIILILLTTSSFGQRKIKSFSEDFPTYLIELEDFMTASQNKELKSTYRLFKNTVNSESFNQNNREEIILISNKMLKKRLKPNPHFKYLLQTLIILSSNPQSTHKISQWNKVILKILTHSTTKKFTTFCLFTNELIKTNNLRYGKSVSWQTDSKEYDFLFEFSEPYISFSNFINLTCITQSGTLTIEKTRGKYFPLKNTWEGNKGLINWQNQGLPKDTVYTELSFYKLDFRSAKIIADSVFFYNKYIFKEPILGQVINKIVSGKQAETYPRFTSKHKNIQLRDILPNVDYQGGYKMIGKDFVADGGKYAEANIIFKREGIPVFVANANRFNITNNKIVSKDARVKIFFDNDSIYHSNLKFTYFNNKRLLQLIRDNQGIAGSPIVNTYHRLNMDFELLEWNIDEDIVRFGSLPNTAISNANFESTDLYLEERFNKLGGIDEIHPLFLIDKYVKIKKEDRFYVSDFAKFTGYSLDQIERFLLNLANKGFVFYDINEERITVQESLYRYINAKSEQGDYDVISFNSELKTGIKSRMIENAALDLRTKDLMIAGIPIIQLSNAQKVFFIPNRGRIIVKKNRDFVFSGKISTGSGRFNLFGQNFHFHYDNFKVDLNKIDSVQLFVPEIPIKRDMYGNEILIKAKTVIEAVTGDLRIDHPTNKSGLRKDSFPEYPIFRSFEKSFVYYDDDRIFNGVYKRENFSFLLDTFQIDSLDNYTGKGLAFSGVFQSAGIFPIFNDTLRLQSDYSLGFNRSTPLEGFEIYAGKANYFNNIHLSHEGLRGAGIFKYLNSSSVSDNILFFPDSLNMKTNTFDIQEIQQGIEFPKVHNTHTNIHFEPYRDKLFVSIQQEPFNFYNNQALFSGDLLMQPIGLTGSGLMNLDNAELNSKLFTYNSSWFSADTADLKVFENTSGLLAIQANNLRSYIDLKDRTGIFQSNGSNSFMDLTSNQYRCYINQLTWKMDKQEIILGDQDNLSNFGTKFVSLHPQQDSLDFIAKEANYNLSDNIIYARGVEYLDVADALIFPDSGIVTIAKHAQIELFENAKIIADNLTEHHIFTDAKVQVDGAYSYTASGNYIYTNASGNNQEIFFNEIKVNQDTTTVAKGNVKEDRFFRINNRYGFKGDINLFADKKDLVFDGFFKINHECQFLDKEWVQFRSLINPENIVFNLSKKIYNDKKESLFTGIAFSIDSLDLYSCFFNQKDRAIDPNILQANYSLSYNENESCYVIGGPDSLDNYFRIFDESCIVEADGIFDMNMDLGRIDIKTVGSISHNIKTKEKEITGFFMLNFFFSEKALDAMFEDIYSSPGDEFYEYDHQYAKNLARIVGKKDGERLLVDLEMKDQFVKFPKQMNYTLAFTDMNFKWVKKHNAYISTGRIGLGNIYKNQVNGILEGHILLENGRNTDELTIYLQTEFGEIYYFNYKNGVMYTYSTNQDFMNILSEIKDKKRRAPQERGKKAYRYQLVKEKAIEKFYNKIQKNY